MMSPSPASTVVFRQAGTVLVDTQTCSWRAFARRNIVVRVHFLDRLTDVVGSGGESISSAEVEGVLTRPLAIEGVAALGYLTSGGMGRRTPSQC
jgi:acyl-CoA synthetase (AMP-forming)/AMP-acid ligase II